MSKETTMPESGTDLTPYIRRVVRTVAGKGGTKVVSRQVIQAALETGDSAEEVALALEVFDAMIDSDMILKGVLNATPEVVGMLNDPDLTDEETESAGPVRRTQPSAEGRLVTVPLGQVVVCPLNPRKRVDQASIEEMADSILEHDIVQPPIARPGLYVDTWEVVFGQRRLLGKRRAVEKARELGRAPMQEVIQLIVREMDDRTALEEAWVENLQKVDLPAREEVEGFQAMLGLRDEEGQLVYSVTSLAARLGKAKQFISRRLRLRHAPDSMWASYEAGAIGLRQMELVGQLPTEAARKKAADEVLRPSFRPTGNPLTVLETVAMLKEKFMVSLRGCGWDLEDEGLVPAKRVKGERVWGGGCADCPMRTGSDEELQDVLATGKAGSQGVDGYSCLMPSCFEEKREALWGRTQREASEAGSRVLSPEEAKRTFYAWGAGGPAPASGLVSLSGHPGFSETGHHASEDMMPTWGEMIGKVAPADVVVGRNETTGEIHRMLKRERAIALAEGAMGKSGKDSPFSNRPGLRKEEASTEVTEEGLEEDATGSDDEVSPWQKMAKENAKMAEAVSRELRRMVTLERAPSDEVMVELIAGGLFEAVDYGDSFLRLLEAAGIPEFTGERGAEGERVREYLDEVVKPHLARAPLAWAALALLETYEQVVRYSSVPESESLLQALGLDRETILAEDGEA
jgi:ParB/RepB/Spo0J family partition protein